MDEDNNAEIDIFAVKPKSHIIPFSHNIYDSTTKHDAYKVYNIGRTDVLVDLLFANGQYWTKVEERTVVKPGHTVIIDNAGKFFFISGIRISNDTEKRAIVHCQKIGDGGETVTIAEPESSGPLDVAENFIGHLGQSTKDNSDQSPLCYKAESVYEEDPEPSVSTEEECHRLKATYTVGVKHVDYVNKGYQALLDAYWPDNSTSIWEDILAKLQPLLVKELFVDCSTIVSEFMPKIKQKLETLSAEYNNNYNHSSYCKLKLTEDLREFQEKLMSRVHNNQQKSRLLVLPLYSNVILLEVTFYALGIINTQYTSSGYIEKDLKDTINKATDYIKDLYGCQLDYSYNTSCPEDLYNSLMNVRTYTTIHGLEYLTIWNAIARYPLGGGKALGEGHFSYSNFFGRQTPNLVREATVSKMFPPLTPCYHNLKRVLVYLWRGRFSLQSPKIGGMKVTFEDWSSYIMGTETEEFEEFELGETYITKLEVTGRCAVDSCTFHLSDGRVLFLGTIEKDSKKDTFELNDHMIVSVFVSSDHLAYEGQAANISVAFNKLKNCRW